jgi:hypothetical protein
MDLTISVEDERAIVQTLLRWPMIIDRRRWEDCPTLFDPDVIVDYGHGRRFEGLAAAIPYFREYLDPCGPSHHLLAYPRFETEDGLPRTVAYAQARHRGQGERAHLFFDSNGEYRDVWRRGPAGWRIIRRTAEWWIHMGDPAALGRQSQPGDPAHLRGPAG